MDALFRIRRFILSIADRLSFAPPTLARVAIGIVFMGTGWGKLHNLDKITGFFTDLGIPAPGFNAVLASSAELVCGVLILVGLFTRLAAIPLIIVMAVAIVTARRSEIGCIGRAGGGDRIEGREGAASSPSDAGYITTSFVTCHLS